jgi:hypothetical protein
MDDLSKLRPSSLFFHVLNGLSEAMIVGDWMATLMWSKQVCALVFQVLDDGCEHRLN